jgi:hypothetical protein
MSLAIAGDASPIGGREAEKSKGKRSEVALLTESEWKVVLAGEERRFKAEGG